MNQQHLPLKTSWRGLILIGLAAHLASCSPRVPTGRTDLPEVEGSWVYAATEIRPVGATSSADCKITGMRLDLGPWRREGFFGRTSGGVLECSAELAPLSAPLPSYAVRRGGAVGPYIAFDLGTPAWRHEGALEDEVMVGRFVLQQGLFELEGKFRVTRAP